VTIYWLSAL